MQLIVCVITAVTDSGDGFNNFLGVVVGSTKERAEQCAKKKWNWYGSTDEQQLYYAGRPKVTVRWFKV